jgi:hypothetical protein
LETIAVDTRIVALVICLVGSWSLVVWTVARWVFKRQQPQTRPALGDLEQRLDRIEAAVESIAIEVERNGELQRFTARLASGEPVALRPPAERSITPH